jgi:hypothetical protein
MGMAFELLVFWCGRLLEGKRIAEGKRTAKGELLASLRAKTLRKLRENMGQSKSKERGFKQGFKEDLKARF